jgi:glycosyltransferase involved in cell wall biosynthesis
MNNSEKDQLGNEKLVVAFVTNMLPPYRISMYNEVSKITSFTVILDTMSEFNRSWRVPEQELAFPYMLQNCFSFVYKRTRGDVNYTESRQFQFSQKTIPMLRQIQPDVVVTIEYGLKSMWCILYSTIYRVPMILVSEGTLHTEGHVGWFKRALRKFMVTQCARLWSNGPESTELLISYGADPNRVDEGMTGIDTLQWRQKVLEQIPHRDQTRAKWNLKGKVLLFSGALSARKGVKQLALAVERWLSLNCEAEMTLLLLGDGEHRAWLEEWSLRCPRANLVMTGFVQRDDLPPFFAAADWAVLPTLDDNWPLASLETCVAGLPQLFSCYNGATRDLLQEGTGVLIDPLNEESFLHGLDCFYHSGGEKVPEGVIDELSEYYSSSQQANRAMESFRLAKSLRTV